MSRVITLVAVTLLFTAPGAFAQEKPDFRWDPKKEPVDEVGDKYFIEEDLTDFVKSKVEAPGREPQVQDQETVRRFRAVHEVLAAEGGKATRKRVVVERWEVTPKGGPADRTLAGKTIVVEGPPAARKATVDGGEAGLSRAAKEWIQKELIIDRPGVKEAMNPKAPVADGEEWPIDPAVVVEQMFKGAEIDPAKSSGKARLSQVQEKDGVHRGHVDVSIAIQLLKLPGTPLAWKEGGLLEVTFGGEVQLDPPGHGSRADISVKLGGVAEVEGETGVTRVRMELHSKGTQAKGPVDG